MKYSLPHTFMYKGKEVFSPKYDLVFKKIFANENDLEPLRALLADILNLDIAHIQLVELQPTELNLEISTKLPRLDVRARLNDNTYVNIEVQLASDSGFLSRLLHYLCGMYFASFNSGDVYTKPTRCISIAILNYNLLKDEEAWFNSYSLANCVSGKKLTNSLEMHFLELLKFNEKKAVENLRNGVKLKPVDKWSLLFRTKDETVLDLLAEQEPIMTEITQKISSVTEEERIRFTRDMYEKAEWQEKCRIYDARVAGHEEGLAEGMEKGRAEGRAEVVAATVKCMRSRGLGEDLISEVTGLSASELKTMP